jgi:hypothetical protein
MTDNEMKNWVIDQLQKHMLEHHNPFSYGPTDEEEMVRLYAAPMPRSEQIGEKDFVLEAVIKDRRQRFGQWQPIETAPADYYVLVWEIYGDKKEGDIYICVKREHEWFTYAGAPVNPTHWMPLPEPPNED